MPTLKQHEDLLDELWTMGRDLQSTKAYRDLAQNMLNKIRDFSKDEEPTLNLYQLTRINPIPGYDKAHSFVIRAQSEDSARLQASAAACDEGPITWLESTMSTCELLTAEGPVEIILRELIAG